MSTTVDRRAALAEGEHGTFAPNWRSGHAWLTVSGLGLGFIYFWAFIDKLLGLGYATPSERAWLNGGSPTKGFLGNLEQGPLMSFFHSIAGAGWVNLLFMAGLFAIGVAFMTGIALRIASWAGATMMVLMWVAEWPLIQGSTNPIMDYHLIYAMLGFVLAALAVGTHSYLLGRTWEKLPVVQSNPWLR